MSSRGSEAWLLNTWGPAGAIGAKCACGDHRGTVQRMAVVTIAGAPVTINERSIGAWKVFDLLTRRLYGRTPDPKRTGAYNFRHKMHKCYRDLSNHSWGLALDLDWGINRYGVVSPYLPPAFIAAIEALRTVDGNMPVFRWGGRWRTRDDMHFEVIATPEELASGIVGYDGLELLNMRYVRLGEKNASVGELQARLVGLGYDLGAWGPDEDGVDWSYGGDTKTAVATVQGAYGIKEHDLEGSTWVEVPAGEWAGPRTWAKLDVALTATPDLGTIPQDVSTLKAQVEGLATRKADKTHTHRVTLE